MCRSETATTATTTTSSSTTFRKMSDRQQQQRQQRRRQRRNQVSIGCLQLLIGPTAAKCVPWDNKNQPSRRRSQRSSTTPWFPSLLPSWLWMTFATLLVVGQCIQGGWDAVFDSLEQLVVPFYTGLVVLYLLLLLVAGPLETMYQWMTGNLSSSSSAIRTTTTRRKTRARQEETLVTPAKRQTKENDDLDEVPILVSEEDQQVDSAPAVVLKEAIKVPQSQEQAQTQPFDLSGAYKLIRNENFDGFLAVQGVPWALRQAANQARPIHRITHIGNQLTIKIEGIIESQTTYTIGGPPVETNVRGRIFRDVVQYWSSGETACPVRGIVVSKTALTENYDVTVQRVLSEDGQEIHMTSRAVFRDGREPVQCKQRFQRIVEEE
ncbi:hypothetical protein ACA910_002455 [Epithemia clementina (nom. ined.)]